MTDNSLFWNSYSLFIGRTMLLDDIYVTSGNARNITNPERPRLGHGANRGGVVRQVRSGWCIPIRSTNLVAKIQTENLDAVWRVLFIFGSKSESVQPPVQIDLPTMVNRDPFTGINTVLPFQVHSLWVKYYLITKYLWQDSSKLSSSGPFDINKVMHTDRPGYEILPVAR